MKLTISSTDVKQQPVRLEDVGTLVVEDDQGNPIFLAIQQAPDVLYTVSADEQKFAEMIQELGISKRLKVHRSMLE